MAVLSWSGHLSPKGLLMIEPTAEQVAAFKEAWEAEHDRQVLSGDVTQSGDRTRAGLRAVLNLGSH